CLDLAPELEGCLGAGFGTEDVYAVSVAGEGVELSVGQFADERCLLVARNFALAPAQEEDWGLHVLDERRKTQGSAGRRVEVIVKGCTNVRRRLSHLGDIPLLKLGRSLVEIE